MISVRQAVVSDADAITALTGQLGYDVAPARVAARLTRFLSQPDDHHVLLAEAGGEPAGWLHASIVEYIEAERFVMICGLVVERRHRGRGVGSALLQEAETWALRVGCPIVRLWSTSLRTAAHRFYERRGYTIVKTQHAFVKAVGAGAEPLAAFVPRVEE